MSGANRAREALAVAGRAANQLVADKGMAHGPGPFWEGDPTQRRQWLLALHDEGLLAGLAFIVNERRDWADWQPRAACAGMDPDVFFYGAITAENREVVALAAATCAACPVALECLQATGGVQQGYSGRLNARERHSTFTRAAMIALLVDERAGGTRLADLMTASGATAGQVAEALGENVDADWYTAARGEGRSHMDTLRAWSALAGSRTKAKPKAAQKPAAAVAVEPVVPPSRVELARRRRIAAAAKRNRARLAA